MRLLVELNTLSMHEPVKSLWMVRAWAKYSNEVKSLAVAHKQHPLKKNTSEYLKQLEMANP
jgi:hypothetical protein